MLKRVMPPAQTETALRSLVDLILKNNSSRFAVLLAESPSLASASFARGATRQDAEGSAFYLEVLGRYIYAGDTALHIAAASYRAAMASLLMQSGADIRARNRRGNEPLHAAAIGNPASPLWDPEAQEATIACLIEAGADPNAQNKDGATPLHLAVRSRCANAVQALLRRGADAAIKNRNGSTAVQLTLHTTGASGSGSPEAKAHNREIIRLLRGQDGSC